LGSIGTGGCFVRSEQQFILPPFLVEEKEKETLDGGWEAQAMIRIGF